MKFKIAADSSSNVLRFPGVDFVSVPLTINTEAAEYVDDENLNVEKMVEEIKETKGKSGTSCPNIHDWLQAFEGADRIFAIAITSNLSGSCAAAIQAKEEYEQTHPGAKVHVIDTLSTGPEMELIMEKLRQWIQDNHPFEKMVEAIHSYKEKTHLLFCLESLTNLARNGRVSTTAARIAGVLGIRVVGKASNEGTLEQLHKCRGEKKALETIFEEMKRMGFRGSKTRISHCFNLEAAKKLKEHILTAYPGSDVQIGMTRGLCSFYAEQGGLLIGFES